MKEQGLITSFDKSFYLEEISQLELDLGDVAIDLLSDNLLIDKIPVLGLLHGIYKTYKNISTGRLIKKIGVFLFSMKGIKPDEKHRFIDELDKEINDRGSEFLLDLIDRYDNINKVSILSNLAKSRIEGKITISEFFLLSKIIDNTPYNLFAKLSDYKTENNIYGETDMLFCCGLLYVSSINPEDKNDIN